MSIFWLIALAMAAFLAWCLVNGKVPVQNRIFVDRAVEPKRFWFVIVCLGAGVAILFAQAISHSLSNGN